MFSKQTKRILDVKVDLGFTMEAVIAKVDQLLNKKGTHLICTTNPEMIMEAQHDRAFKCILNKAALSLPDGFGVVLAVRYLDALSKVPFNVFYGVKAFLLWLFLGATSFFDKELDKNVIRGVDLFLEMCALAEVRGYSVFLLGGSFSSDGQEVAALTAKKLHDLYPNIKIIGATSKFSSDAHDDISSTQYIRDCMSKANVTSLDVIFIAYGHDAQETWFARNARILPVKLGVGVGGTFDYVSGFIRRPTSFVRHIHLEWLYRLFTQPYRFKRIYTAFVSFPFAVYKATRLSTRK